MKNDFKSDWETCFRLHENWWKGIDTGKPLLMRIKREYKNVWQPETVPLSDRYSLEAFWTDIGAIIDRAETEMSHRIYKDAVYPYYAPCLGPGSLGLFLGAKPHFMPETVWYEPCFIDIRQAQAVLEPSNRWWRWTQDASFQAMQRSKGRYLVALPDIVEGLDCVAALLGTEKTLQALNDAPSEVHRLMMEITDCWYKAFEELYKIISHGDGGNAFLGFEIVGPGKTAKLQCDISAMLSPAMFEKFVLPYLSEQADWLDYTLYHLDGTCALQHLDLLCNVKGIDCIQWIPGVGKPGGHDECWDSMYRKILDSGKGLMIYTTSKHADGFVKKFGTKGVYINLCD